MTTVKVGDNMLIRYRHLGGGASIRQVEKVYKRYFLCGGRKWQIGGFMRCIGGDDWNRPTIRRATPEDIAEVSAAMRRRAVVNNEWRKEDQAVIDAVHAIITATAPRQAPNPSDKPAGSTP